MWYEEKLLAQPDDTIYTRKELFLILQEINPELSYNSFKWLLSELLSKKLIYRRGYDTYSRSKMKATQLYTPLYSQETQKLKAFLEEEYPLAEFCIFESFLLNEFLNHQIAQNTVIIQVEKDLGAFVFDFLEENSDKRVLYKPKQEEYMRYWTAGCIIIVDKISEAPNNKQNPHDMVLEKLLVDVFAEPMIRCLFSASEYPLIMETAMERYSLDEKKMMRYARRRNAADKLKKYMEQ
ncbi:MAG: hypothetical protein Q4F24_17845 [Eubacteriales bacterium]|nr:hypothetical protein [Eubacteriales bacterium]